MNIIIDKSAALHFFAIGSTDSHEVTNRQELRVSVQFAEGSMIDPDTEEVELKLKLSHQATGLAGSVTLPRVGTTTTFAAFLNLSTSVLNAITGTAAVWMECTWLLGGKLQRSDPRQVTVRQSLTTGEEGAPEADQTLTDRAAWLEDSLVAGDNITLEFDPLTGRVTITGAAGGASEVAWADITGKPSTFPPEAHTHNIYVRGSLTADSAAIRVRSADGATTVGYLPLLAEWPGES